MGKIGQFFIGAAKNPSAGQTKRINTAHLYGFVAKLLGHCFDVISLCFVSGDKPHACDLCNKKFALACNLRAHMKTHEGDPQEECTRCGKMYICNGTPDACPKCRGQNGAPHGDSAEDSSGNHTEDSNTPE
ncbi:hypothetical protein Zmor_025223 [Zophobas morio]|uniref:C2H2-type domain-containing protein n=1 Tax=Zophobas morio TaxID=2755281 RepID=A0AA38HWH4_9CUCU|nr:hypothetical protein Zmor_025223 [Zophobas morio]